MQDQAIRSSSTFANGHGMANSKASSVVNRVRTPMPVDYDVMLAANQLDVKLYRFAEAVQVRPLAPGSLATERDPLRDARTGFLHHD